jgi:hypothetical protein
MITTEFVPEHHFVDTDSQGIPSLKSTDKSTAPQIINLPLKLTSGRGPHSLEVLDCATYAWTIELSVK